MRDHTSLEAWQEARWLTRYAVALARQGWKPWAGEVIGQLQRSALSIQLNVAEGYALQGSRRFCNHLTIASGSAVEVGDLIQLVADEGLTSPDTAAEALARCRRCPGLLLGLIKW